MPDALRLVVEKYANRRAGFDGWPRFSTPSRQAAPLACAAESRRTPDTRRLRVRKFRVTMLFEFLPFAPNSTSHFAMPAVLRG